MRENADAAALPAYQGRLVHRAASPDGLVEVVDTGEIRALHFGTSSRQSGMWRRHPHRLQLPYTRAMMSFLLLLPAPPKAVLLLGLGGGSIAKFLLHQFPECHIHAVERNPEVVRVAHEYFALPRDERLRILVDDAAHFITGVAEPDYYDAVLVDAFGPEGAADCVARPSFIQGCRSTLNRQGVLALNLWRGRGSGYGQIMKAVRRSFDSRPGRVKVRGRGNIIGLATRDPNAFRHNFCSEARSRIDSRALGLDFSDYAAQLRSQRRWWRRIL